MAKLELLNTSRRLVYLGGGASVGEGRAELVVESGPEQWRTPENGGRALGGKPFRKPPWKHRSANDCLFRSPRERSCRRANRQPHPNCRPSMRTSPNGRKTAKLIPRWGLIPVAAPALFLAPAGPSFKHIGLWRMWLDFFLALAGQEVSLK